MSEQNITRATEVATDPPLNLIFDGLFFFCFNAGGDPPAPAVSDPASECRIGFLTTAPRHVITISGERKIPVGDQTVIEKFDFTLTHKQARKIGLFELDVPGVASPSVRREGHGGTIDRNNPTEANKKYFQWIIDMEQSPLHATKLTPVPGVLKPVMHVNIGKFYTDSLSDVRYYLTKVDEEPRQFGKVAARTGLIIDTLPQGKASLKIGDLNLPLVEKAGATCKVTIKNRCPVLDGVMEKLAQLKLRPLLDDIIELFHFFSPDPTPEEIKDLLRRLQGSDFPLYYHAFDVKIRGQFDFEPVDEERAFPPAVCYAASGSETTNI
jgi:hypothetical protein